MTTPPWCREKNFGILVQIELLNTTVIASVHISEISMLLDSLLKLDSILASALSACGLTREKPHNHTGYIVYLNITINL